MAHNPHHRILALSATPGKNSESVQAIVDGLHISRIEIRDEHSMDLQKYLFKKVRELVRVCALFQLLINSLQHTDIQIVQMNDSINAIKTSLAAVMMASTYSLPLDYPLIPSVALAQNCSDCWMLQ